MHVCARSAVSEFASNTFARKLKDSHGAPIPEDRSTLRALLVFDSDSDYPQHLSLKSEAFTFITNFATAADKYDIERATKGGRPCGHPPSGEFERHLWPIHPFNLVSLSISVYYVPPALEQRGTPRVSLRSADKSD